MNVRYFLTLCACFFALVTSSSAQDWFTGSTSTDWNDASNWFSGALPDGTGAQVIVGSTVTPGALNATADITGPLTNMGVGELRVGSSSFNTAGSGDEIAGTTGTVNHSAGQLDSAGWSFVGVDGNPGGGTNVGTYNLSGSAVLTQGNVFALGVGGSGGVNEGIMNISGGTFTNGASGADGGLAIGWDLGNSGTLNQTGGVVNTVWSTVAVNTPGTTGTFNFSGGEYNSPAGLTVGENDGTNGVANISGTADLNVGGLFIGRNDGSTGALNITGSTATIDATDCFVGLNDAGADTTAVGNVSFTLDANGVSPINCSNAVGFGDDANLLVDASAFSGTGDILLYNNTGANPVGGMFAGLAEGAAVPGSNGRFITYTYGDGNDVALIVPEPTSVLLLLGCIGAFFMRRK